MVIKVAKAVNSGNTLPLLKLLPVFLEYSTNNNFLNAAQITNNSFYQEIEFTLTCKYSN